MKKLQGIAKIINSEERFKGKEFLFYLIIMIQYFINLICQFIFIPGIQLIFFKTL